MTSTKPFQSSLFTQTLVLVTGHPAVGKTTFARQLALCAALPLFSKDDFKELGFDLLGVKSRDESRMLGCLATKCLRYCAAQVLSAKGGVVLESNFQPGPAKEEIGALCLELGARVLEVNLHATKDVCRKRFLNRGQSQERHSGHADVDFSELEARMTADPKGIVGLGTLIAVDTSDFTNVNFEDVWLAILAALER
ncbi:MAG: AAA family ATPase [Silvanigrellales bacterium]|nr:AAA family ATPase [Silvanigrellales bacterium]